jgi:hypothetical protein
MKIISVILFIFLVQAAFSQKTVDLTTGASIPELLNLGLRFQLKQAQIGISAGTIPNSEEKVFSGSTDLYLHFGKAGKYSDRKPNYFRVGINYSREESEYSIFKYMYFSPRIGRDLNLSKRAGINLDGGVAIQIYEKEIIKKPLPGGWDFDFDFPVLPAVSVSFFYRL